MNKLAKRISFAEFVILMALYVALMAMSIDMMLPALDVIGKEFNLKNQNQSQYIISTLFLGFTFGQLIYGPISDSYGRKLTIYSGLIIFIIGNILSLKADDFQTMLIGRFLQGFGVASPRTTSIAIIRDLYAGREMARVISFIMTIFIIIPIIAPSIGQIILFFTSWRIFFIIFLACAIIAFLWTLFRLPETLHKKDVRPFNLKIIKKDFYAVISNKLTLGYSICAGLIFGGLIGYLNSSRQIFQDYFGVGNSFPFYFAASAISIGSASMVNSMIVRRFGMRLICHYSLLVMMILAAIFMFLSIYEHNIDILQFMIFALISFFCLGLLFGNLNALAMEPMAHYAGIAAAVVGFLSSGISAVIGTIIGQAFNNTLTPIFTGFLILSILSFSLLFWLKNIPKIES